MKRFSVSLCLLLGLLAVAPLRADEDKAEVKPVQCEGLSCCPSTQPSCYRTCGLVAGVEATFLKPNIKGGDITMDGGYYAVRNQTLADFEEMQGAPRLWIGFENEDGLGIRTRYWDFAAGARGTDGFLGTPPNFNDAGFGQATVELQTYTIDLEVYKHFKGDVWDIIATGGFRYGHRELSESLFAFDRADRVNAFSSLLDQAGGAGLTGALELGRRLGDSNFELFGTTRGSVLWGNAQSRYLGALSVNGATAYQSILADDNATTTIFEFQLGLRWSRPVKCLSAEVFSHLAFEYQVWDTDGGMGNPATLVGPGYSLTSHALDRKVEFAGIAWGFGIKH